MKGTYFVRHWIEEFKINGGLYNGQASQRHHYDWYTEFKAATMGPYGESQIKPGDSIMEVEVKREWRGVAATLEEVKDAL